MALAAETGQMALAASESDNGSVLQPEMMREFSGQDDVSQADMLVLRGLGLADVQALEAAPNLTSLSLSHNALRQIALPRGALPLLVELNINKNALASLTFLECCPALQRLYASNNRFADVSPLASCPSLSLVGIHGNFLEDLAQALEALCRLATLSELELDGNPIASAPGYKHMVVHRLGELKMLDGEMLTSKDREDASHFVAYQSRREMVFYL